MDYPIQVQQLLIERVIVNQSERWFSADIKDKNKDII